MFVLPSRWARPLKASGLLSLAQSKQASAHARCPRSGHYLGFLLPHKHKGCGVSNLTIVLCVWLRAVYTFDVSVTSELGTAHDYPFACAPLGALRALIARFHLPPLTLPSAASQILRQLSRSACPRSPAAAATLCISPARASSTTPQAWPCAIIAAATSLSPVRPSSAASRPSCWTSVGRTWTAPSWCTSCTTACR